MLLRRLQELIGGIYDVRIAHDVYDFLVTDRARLPEGGALACDLAEAVGRAEQAALPAVGPQQGGGRGRRQRQAQAPPAVDQQQPRRQRGRPRQVHRRLLRQPRTVLRPGRGVPRAEPPQLGRRHRVRQLARQLLRERPLAGLDRHRPVRVDPVHRRRVALDRPPRGGERARHVQRARAADRLGALVPIEPRPHLLDQQVQRVQDRLDLEAQRRLPLAVAVAEEQPRPLVAAQRLAAPGGEQAHALRRVGRVGERQVGRSHQVRWQPQPQVGEPARDGAAHPRCRAVDVL